MSAAENRRTEPRRRTLRAARIVFGDFRFTLDCIVRDWNEGGARLRCEHTSDAPNDFYVFDTGTLRKAEVAWRRGNELGVKFTGEVINVIESTDPRHARFKYLL